MAYVYISTTYHAICTYAEGMKPLHSLTVYCKLMHIDPLEIQFAPGFGHALGSIDLCKRQ